MNTLKNIQLVAILTFLAAALSGCTTVNHPTVSALEVASKLGVSQESETLEIADSQYTNFCTRKGCDGAKLRYSKVLRETAILTQAISLLDAESVRIVNSSQAPTALMQDGSEELPILRSELKTLRLAASKLHPQTDFDDVELQEQAFQALQQARRDLRTSQALLGRVETNINTVLGEEAVTISWNEAVESAPQLAILDESVYTLALRFSNTEWTHGETARQ